MADDDAELDSAIAATNAILLKHPERASDPTLPVYRYAAACELEREKHRFESGDKMALMAAIRLCANHDMAMPSWTSAAFIRAYDGVLNYKVKSWDDAFGSPLPKGSHIAARRKKRLKAPAVWLAVNEAATGGRPIDDNLFDEVGRELGVGKTLAAEYYYSMLKVFPHLNRVRKKWDDSTTTIAGAFGINQAILTEEEIKVELAKRMKNDAAGES